MKSTWENNIVNAAKVLKGEASDRIFNDFEPLADQEGNPLIQRARKGPAKKKNKRSNEKSQFPALVVEQVVGEIYDWCRIKVDEGGNWRFRDDKGSIVCGGKTKEEAIRTLAIRFGRDWKRAISKKYYRRPKRARVDR